MNTVIVAGAGTGKTYALVQEYVASLLGLDGSKEIRHPASILAVTFTEKAAAEMRTRVTSKLLKIARDKTFDDWMIERAHQLDMALPSWQQLRVLSRELLSAPICTFHSFCSQILREHATTAKIDPAFTLLSPVEENEIALEVAERVILNALSNGAAGIGSLIARFQLRRFGDAKGLAENLVSLYHELSEQGMAAGDIALPFAPMGEPFYRDPHFLRLLDDVKTCLERFCGTKLTVKASERAGQVKKALQSFLAILNDEPDLEVRLSATFRELRASVSGRFGSDEQRQPLVKAILALGSCLCHAVTSPDVQAVRFLLEQFALRFDAHKDHFALMGFGDLLKRARALLRNNLAVRKSVKDRFQRVLVDEFQDTSPLQEDLVALLCEHRHSLMTLEPGQRAMAHLNLGANVLFVVGDPKQSIYGFRGADVQLFNHTLNVVTRDDEQSSGGRRESLTLCRRSQGAIVELVNLVGSATLTMGDEVLFDKQDYLSAIKPAQDTAGAIWKACAGKDQNKEITMALALAKKIRELLDTNTARAKDIAILVRRIKAAAPIVSALQQLGIAARISGGDGFFARSEVMDLLAALKLVVDPDDELATLTVLRSPLVAMPDSDLVAALDGISNWKGGLRFSQIASGIEHTAIDIEVKDRILAFAALLERIRSQLGYISIAEAIDVFLDAGHYTLALAVEDDADDRLANVLKLRSLCVGFRGDASAQINRLWNRLDNPPKESLAEPLDVDVNSLCVMTIHQSKGLEFDVVVLADTLSVEPNDSDNILFDKKAGLAVNHRGRPISVCAPKTSDEKKESPTPIDVVRQHKRKSSEAEFARLLYVALTRAKERIYFMDVEVDGKDSSDRGVCLRRLLLQGRQRDAALFDRLLPTCLVPTEDHLPKEELSAVQPAIRTYSSFIEQPQSRRRILASEIGSFQSRACNDVYNEGSVQKAIPRKILSALGTLAHRLIASVGAQMDANSNENDIKNLLRAAARSNAIELSTLSNNSLDVLTLCSRTLCGPILQLLRDQFFLEFEVPLYFESEDFVIDGSADLIAHGATCSRIIDFKSSIQSAKSESTWLQLSAYAAALREQIEQPIFVSPCVLGETSTILWHEYTFQDLAHLTGVINKL